MKTAVLHDSPFCPYETLREFTREQAGFETAANTETEIRGKVGALASFCGIARGKSDQTGDQTGVLRSLHLDCYPAMAERCLEEIVAEARARWQVFAATIHHRYGEVPVGETIVLVACLSARRAHAFEACRYMTDMVKVRPPLWKREQSVCGENAWVEANDKDTRCAEQWHAKHKAV